MTYDVIAVERIGVDPHPPRTGAPLPRVTPFGELPGGPATDSATGAAIAAATGVAIASARPERSPSTPTPDETDETDAALAAGAVT
ncbi:hypothetical protein ACH5AO_04235 [Streptomyces sp. NPDC018964]|uniref:hypothetical protein n=1 Tax=Streptomyces sp. NPDC018964 TaxID=3365058 RepID=UPI00378FA220